MALGNSTSVKNRNSAPALAPRSPYSDPTSSGTAAIDTYVKGNPDPMTRIAQESRHPRRPEPARPMPKPQPAKKTAPAPAASPDDDIWGKLIPTAPAATPSPSTTPAPEPASPEAATPKPVPFEVKVLDREGHPLDARVDIKSVEDVDGSHSESRPTGEGSDRGIIHTQLPPGRYRILVTSDGYLRTGQLMETAGSGFVFNLRERPAEPNIEVKKDLILLKSGKTAEEALDEIVDQLIHKPSLTVVVRKGQFEDLKRHLMFKGIDVDQTKFVILTSAPDQDSAAPAQPAPTPAPTPAPATQPVPAASPDDDIWGTPRPITPPAQPAPPPPAATSADDAIWGTPKPMAPPAQPAAALGTEDATPVVVTQDDKAKAKDHFRKGENLYARGKYEEAITEFENAYKLDHVPAILFNLAQCYRLRNNPGDLEKASFLYQQFLRTSPQDVPQRTTAQRFIDDLEKQIAKAAAATSSPAPAPAPVAPPPAPAPATPPPPPAPVLLAAEEHPLIKQGKVITAPVEGTYDNPEYKGGKIVGLMIIHNMEKAIKLFTGEDYQSFGQLPKVLKAQYSNYTLQYVFDSGGIVRFNIGYSIRAKIVIRSNGAVTVNWTNASTQLTKDPRNGNSLINLSLNDGGWAMKPVEGYKDLYEVTWTAHTKTDESTLPWEAKVASHTIVPDSAVTKQTHEDTAAIFRKAAELVRAMR